MIFSNGLYKLKTNTKLNGDTSFEISDPDTSIFILLENEEVQSLAFSLLHQSMGAMKRKVLFVNPPEEVSDE
jgi:hypothetical protein|tara:strand:+ start:1609 stop:1824 length:216 start_codon:yes stop_codon:yes gene_type:complete